jgi:cholest-4-en-3-one 26-monooxygenase
MGIDPADDAVWATLMNAIVSADDPDINPEGPESVMERDMPEVARRCQELIARRRANPTDDLTSVLVHAEVDGETLTEWEIISGFILLMVAGNDSTKATYCSGMRALIEHPDQRQMLLDDPALIPDAVEEMLRMFPSFAHFRRTATADTELGGCPIPAHTSVSVILGSFNTDETQFERAEEVDFDRDTKGHLAFGGGNHRCLGAHLARMELRVTLEEWLAAVPDFSVKEGVALRYSQGLRSVDNLELVW